LTSCTRSAAARCTSTRRTTSSPDTLVDYRVLSNPADEDVLVEFHPLHPTLLPGHQSEEVNPVELSPGANLTSHADIVANLRATMNPTLFHPIGTAAMMPRDLGGVVDASVMPGGRELSVMCRVPRGSAESGATVRAV
jgi:hypothetical protein